MPAVSKAQQRFMGMVYATKKGDMTNPSPEVAKAAASMKKSDAKDFASTNHKKLPEKKVAKEAADLAKNANVKNLILTHFSARYNDESILLNEAKQIHESVIAAKDLLEIEI